MDQKLKLKDLGRWIRTCEDDAISHDCAFEFLRLGDD